MTAHTRIPLSGGRLNRRIQIQSQSSTQDAAGQQIQSWSTIYSCWAEITVQKSQLIYSTAEFVSKKTYRITWRYTSSVVFEPNMRILYTDPATQVTHTYEIQAFDNDRQDNIQIIGLAYELNGAE